MIWVRLELVQVCSIKLRYRWNIFTSHISLYSSIWPCWIRKNLGYPCIKLLSDNWTSIWWLGIWCRGREIIICFEFRSWSRKHIRKFPWRLLNKCFFLPSILYWTIDSRSIIIFIICFIFRIIIIYHSLVDLFLLFLIIFRLQIATIDLGIFILHALCSRCFFYRLLMELFWYSCCSLSTCIVKTTVQIIFAFVCHYIFPHQVIL